MNTRVALFCKCILLFLCGTGFLAAQTSGSKTVSLTLNEIAILDIEPNTNEIDIVFTTPTEAGMPITTPTVNTTKWLNYTSAKATASPTRTVSAQIDQTFTGIALKINAGAATGGGGTLGTSTGQKTLTTSPQMIVTGIGGTFTGNGANNGHQLSISAEVTNYTQLVQTSNKTITVTYTISN